eukprot:CAMPEP_0173431506 /NCGR_PEP_ID=MMETSP1357-20121228/9629_1 /TAXON_ID=77926 /ORGANISM="Hemiselmis rufescens, Strain PCC563" /LENGTH=402 /DNA_ID=CAMNT_0014395995 /DNA_START=44 /DNA_END=1249 /DNA_ORIENTATION=-
MGSYARDGGLGAMRESHPEDWPLIIIPDKLEFDIHPEDHTQAHAPHRASGSNVKVITSDLADAYRAQGPSDFGPVNLSVLVRFVRLLEQELARLPRDRPASAESNKKPGKSASPGAAAQAGAWKPAVLCYRTDTNPCSVANAVCLFGCAGILMYGQAPDEALAPFRALLAVLPAFRSASQSGPCRCETRVDDCVRSFFRATLAGWFSNRSFNLQDYVFWDHPLNGDLHQLSPKFVVLKSPIDKRRGAQRWDLAYREVRSHPPSVYFQTLRERGVKAIIRFSNVPAEHQSYDAEVFQAAGFRHYELQARDDEVPNRSLVYCFLRICESEGGAVAVHDDSGRGVSCCLVAVWMLSLGEGPGSGVCGEGGADTRDAWTADEAVAWVRLNRGGSITSQQHDFLRTL